MENINIKKGGLRQTVSRFAFEQIYKPNGWKIDEAETPRDEIQETVKTLADEGQIKSFLKMSKKQPKQFDDGLFKSEL